MYTIWMTIIMIIGMALQPASANIEKDASHHSYASSSTFNKAIPAFAYLEPLELKVILKTYDQEELIDTKVKSEKIWAMEDFWTQYDGWVVEEQRIGEIVFQRQLERT
ncbi:BofC N-terminal domain-containing protein [Halobacillus sp. B23F22_1]|uniref:BofC N-terminal domain-containing protein n=1 Tax=Halobacillus sp. B23F22_1 TaxID=3459514 RepID=UPI00373F2B96